MEEDKKLNTKQEKSQAPSDPGIRLYNTSISMPEDLRDRLMALQQELQEQTKTHISMSRLIVSILERFLEKNT